MSINIALTKGRIQKQVIELLKIIQYPTELLENPKRALVLKDDLHDINYFLVKANDCITYVNHGVGDIGIVGKDTLLEYHNDNYELLDLNIGKCKFVVAGLKGHNLFNKTGHIKIGTKYPHVAREYFLNKHMDVEIIKIDGSVELGPILGLCDGIVDLYETGQTIRENGLEVYDSMMDISTRLIVNKASYKLKNKEIQQFITALEEGVKQNVK